jgi:hypothetical protein
MTCSHLFQHRQKTEKEKEKEKEKEIIVEYSINYISWENNLLILYQLIISHKKI